MSQLFQPWPTHPFNPFHAVFGRERYRQGRKHEWHVVGPTLPRIMPTSPKTVSPCGITLNSDTLETQGEFDELDHGWMVGPAKGKTCSFCGQFLAAALRELERGLAEGRSVNDISFGS